MPKHVNPSENPHKKVNEIPRKTTDPKKSTKGTGYKTLPGKNVPPTKTKPILKHESVYDRLYKSKQVKKKTAEKEISDLTTVASDSSLVNKLVKDCGLISDMKNSEFKNRPKVATTTLKSISAGHLKTISKNQLPNYMQRCASIGNKLGQVKEINEDHQFVKEDKVIR